MDRMPKLSPPRRCRRLPGRPPVLLAALTILVAVGACGPPLPADYDEWERRLNDSNLTSAGFVPLYLWIVRDRFEGVEIEQSGPLEAEVVTADGVEIKINLTNVWANCAHNPETRVEMVEEHLKALETSMEAGGPLDPERIVPVVRSAEFIESSNESLEDARLAAEPLVADLFVVYAADRKSQIEFLTRERFDAEGIEWNGLRERALANLRRILPAVTRHEGEGVWMANAGGNYESSLLLLDEMWEEAATLVDGDLVVAVPSRDVVLFTGTSSVDAIERMRSIVSDIHLDGAHLISRALLVRRGRGWEELEASG